MDLVWILLIAYVLLVLWVARRICARVGEDPNHATLIIVPVVGLIFLLEVVWRALPQAGRSRWHTLLVLVPLVNVLMLLFLAFSRWPEEEEDDGLEEENLAIR